MSRIFSDSTRRELLALHDAGAPATAILNEVRKVLGAPHEVVPEAAWKGAPAGPMSEADRATCRKVGSDPDRVASMTEATTYKDWLALKERFERNAGRQGPGKGDAA
jgi:hypothetical protein